MSGFTRGSNGGYIVTTAEGSAVYLHGNVNDETLRAIALALGFTEGPVLQHILEAKSVYIYRGTPPQSGGDQS